MRGFSPGAGGYSRLAVYLLPSGLRPFPGPVCCSGAVSFWKGADGLCCAGAEADDGGLVAEGAAVSVSLRLRRGRRAGGLEFFACWRVRSPAMAVIYP